MIKKLTDRVYYMPHSHETDRPSLGLIVGDKYSLIVDSGNSPKHAREFLKEVEALNVSPVKFLVLTHWHWDHIFGIKEMGLTTVAQENILTNLNKMRELKWDDNSLEKYRLDDTFSDFTISCIKKEIEDRENFSIGDLDLIFKDKIEIELGGISVIVKAVGGDHSADSCVVFVPSDKVMFLGDCYYGTRYNDIYGYTLKKTYKMIFRIEEYEACQYVLSHEGIRDRKTVSELWDVLKTTGKIVRSDTSVDKVIERFSIEYNRLPSKKEITFIKYYADVNKALSLK